jgi:5-methylcytosine-specific restriction endonuclease McrA
MNVRAESMATNPRAKWRDRLRELRGSKCCYCERETVPNVHGAPEPLSETLEHLHRVEDGGVTELHNLTIACWECNSGRGRIDWLVYKSYRMGELTEICELV